MIRRWLASPWRSCRKPAARCASSARRISSPRRWASPTARLRVKPGALLRGAAGVRPGLPRLGGALRGLSGEPAAREVPAAVQPGALSLPRALGLLGREVDSGSGRAPCIELNPADAATRGLEDGDAVEVFNDRGSFRTVLRVNEAVRPESAFMVESTYRQYLDGTIMQSVSNDTVESRAAMPCRSVP